MQLLQKIANGSVSGFLGLVEKANFGLPAFHAFIFLADFSYGTFSKLNFIDPPKKRFNQYVIEYKKAHTTKKNSEKPIALVTGANSGIGFVTSKALVLAGYHVIFACRNENLATEAMSKITKETGIDSCEFIELDLSSLDSIRGFVKRFKSKHTKLHLLINNAGVMMTPYMTTKDGIEFQFGVNHVGHFLLTTSLLDIIKSSAPARIVNLTSMAQYFGYYSIDKILDESKYTKFGNYGMSKLANNMFATSLVKRLEGTGVTVNSVHPGPVNTNLTRYGTLDTNPITWALKKIMFLNSVAGALTSIRVALSPNLEGVTGKYFSNENVSRPLKTANDEVKCEELWRFTEDLIAKHSKKPSK